MKYWAILKDSYREALDTKVFYVSVGLSCLLTLLIASVSFEPLSAQKAFDTIVPQFAVVYRNRGKSLQPGFFPVDYQVKDLKQLNEPGEPQAGDYRFVLEVHDSDRKELSFQKAAHFWNSDPSLENPKKEKSGTASTDMMESFVRGQFAMFGSVEVASVKRLPAPGPTIYRFQVETKGTRGVRGWLHDPSLFFGALPLTMFRSTLGGSVYWIEDTLVNGIGAWVGILLGIVITAFFIPNMLRKGSVDLLVVKPLHRPTLLIYKFIGGLTFIFLNSAVAVIGVWLALGWRSGIWAYGFLATILLLTFYFAILYAVSALIGVLTRSAVVSIIVALGAWLIMFLAGAFYTSFQTIQKDPFLKKEIPDWAYNTVDTVHFVLPRTGDLNLLTTKLISHNVLTDGDIRRRRIDLLPDVTWGESLTASSVFIALMLGLASWRFATKDY